MAQISPEIGLRQWLDLIYHDDGVISHGGVQCGIVGKMGTGKSTLMLQAAQQSRYIPDRSKKQLIQGLMSGNGANMLMKTLPETVIWRGRINDYWNCLLPSNWNRSFPDSIFNPKPVVVWMHESDELTFNYIDDHKKERELKSVDVDVYSTAEDLNEGIGEYEGWINVVYEPQTYVMSEQMIKKLKSRRLEEVDEADVKFTRKFLDPSPPTFWFEFFGYMIKSKPYDFVTVIIDEFHQMVQSRSAGNMWHLIDIFANNFTDLRRNNISLLFTTHQTSFVDYRIADRLAKWIWLPGAKLSGAYSMIWNNALVAQQPIGRAIIEERLQEFGQFEFTRIPKQPPLLRVGGMLE